jgi:hypothetical protein
MRQNDGEDESNQGTLQAHIEMPHWNHPVQLTYANKSTNKKSW